MKRKTDFTENILKSFLHGHRNGFNPNQNIRPTNNKMTKIVSSLIGFL